MDTVSDREKKMKCEECPHRLEILGIYAGNIDFKDEEKGEIIYHFLKEIKNFREKTEEYVRSLEIKNDSLNEENKKLKKEIEELKNLSKENKK